jgi:hypothetical protein
MFASPARRKSNHAFYLHWQFNGDGPVPGRPRLPLPDIELHPGDRFNQELPQSNRYGETGSQTNPASAKFLIHNRDFLLIHNAKAATNGLPAKG